MTVRRLSPHPASTGAAGLELEASVAFDGDRLKVAYRLRGSIADVRLPAGVSGRRRDGLWRTTCFEAFLQPTGDDAYFEFNFATAGEWAAYSFTATREGMAPLETSSPAIRIERADDCLMLEASFPPPAGAAFNVGLAAVIESADGEISWWALAHPSEKPDFHHPDSFLYDLTRASAP
ncbi:MAG: DOMON-like domain-containing protein [Parvularculaceae bacterium]